MEQQHLLHWLPGLQLSGFRSACEAATWQILGCHMYSLGSLPGLPCCNKEFHWLGHRSILLGRNRGVNLTRLLTHHGHVLQAIGATFQTWNLVLRQFLGDHVWRSFGVCHCPHSGWTWTMESRFNHTGTTGHSC